MRSAARFVACRTDRSALVYADADVCTAHAWFAEEQAFDPCTRPPRRMHAQAAACLKLRKLRGGPRGWVAPRILPERPQKAEAARPSSKLATDATADAADAAEAAFAEAAGGGAEQDSLCWCDNQVWWRARIRLNACDAAVQQSKLPVPDRLLLGDECLYPPHPTVPLLFSLPLFFDSLFLLVLSTFVCGSRSSSRVCVPTHLAVCQTFRRLPLGPEQGFP